MEQSIPYCTAQQNLVWYKDINFMAYSFLLKQGGYACSCDSVINN